MRVALYCRVSTSGKGQDTEVQARELREYAARRDWTIIEEFSDSGVSGAKESRPALDEMLKAAKRRKFDAILCWKLDRIGRSLKHLVNLLAELEAVGFLRSANWCESNLTRESPAGGHQIILCAIHVRSAVRSTYLLIVNQCSKLDSAGFSRGCIVLI